MTQTQSQRLFRTLLIALVLAPLAYFAVELLAPTNESPAILLAAGLVTGLFLGALIPDAKPHKQASSTQADDEHKTIFVGNLAFRASTRELQSLFEKFGEVQSARIATDRDTRKPRGFGFVEMAPSAADKAIQALNGSDFCGRTLNLSEARQRSNRAETV